MKRVATRGKRYRFGSLGNGFGKRNGFFERMCLISSKGRTPVFPDTPATDVGDLPRLTIRTEVPEVVFVLLRLFIEFTHLSATLAGCARLDAIITWHWNFQINEFDDN
jgi:hypothetical protein